MKTFADFIASRVECDDLATHFNEDWFAPNTRGYVYDGDTWIQRNGNGFYLVLGNCEYPHHDLRELEAVLYAWCLTECPEDMGVPDDVHRFLCELQNAMMPEEFARALLANVDEPDSMVCHMQDYCDANQCALDAVERQCESECREVNDDTHVDEASALYDRTRPFIR